MQECKLITIKLKREAKSETKSHLHGQPLPPSPQLDQWSVTLCRTARMFSKNRWWKGLAKDWERLIMSIEAREEDHHLTTLSTQFTRPFPLQFFLLSPGFWVLVTEHQSHSDSVSSQASLSSSESEKKRKSWLLKRRRASEAQKEWSEELAAADLLQRPTLALSARTTTNRFSFGQSFSISHLVLTQSSADFFSCFGFW